MNYPYEIVSVGYKAHVLAGLIKIERDSSVSDKQVPTFFASVNTNKQDSLRIIWTNPDPNYNKKYFILVEDILGEYKDLIEVNQNSYTFHLSPYILDQSSAIFVKIIAEDCRESDLMGIKLIAN